MEILRNTTSFLYGIQKPEQLKEILESQEQLIALSFVGRSNVGKSSLINALFGNKTARVSKTPGRTREINIFEFAVGEGAEERAKFWLFDLPGYGFAEVSKKQSENWEKLMNTFFMCLPQSVLVCNVQDARHPHQKADQKFQDFLAPSELTSFLVLNKMDKLKKQKERSELQKKKKMIFSEYKHVNQIHQTSCENKSGIKELEQALINFCLLQKERDEL